MKELVMLRNAHAVVEDETGSASASTLHQRSALLRVQGLDLENEKLAANTKCCISTGHLTSISRHRKCSSRYNKKPDVWLCGPTSLSHRSYFDPIISHF